MEDLVIRDKPTKKQSTSPVQARIEKRPSPLYWQTQPKSITTIVQPSRPYRAVSLGAVSARSKVCWITVLVTLCLLCAGLMLTGLIIGILCGTGVICSNTSTTTYYFYCPEGIEIYAPLNVPITDSNYTDWLIFSSNRNNFLTFFNDFYKIRLCGTDTSASQKYFCRVRQTTANNYFESYCVKSCTVNSFTDCNTPTITRSPILSAVPYYTYVANHSQADIPRRVFASGFEYVSCPTTSYWDVSFGLVRASDL